MRIDFCLILEFPWNFLELDEAMVCAAAFESITASHIFLIIFFIELVAKRFGIDSKKDSIRNLSANLNGNLFSSDCSGLLHNVEVGEQSEVLFKRYCVPIHKLWLQPFFSLWVWTVRRLIVNSVLLQQKLLHPWIKFCGVKLHHLPNRLFTKSPAKD